MAPMSDTADRYRRLSDHFAALVAGVPDGAWSNPSPCEDWTARDLVAHVVETPGIMFRMVDRPFELTASVDDDPVAAFDESRRQVQAELDDPERADAAVDGAFGPSTFAGAIDRFACMDLVIHGWDLARATGQPEQMDPAEVARLTDEVASFGEMLHSPGVCGPEIAVGDDVDPQTRLLAIVGRDARTA
jgi:uncharacterized protein (TIGR03086 family)